MPLMAGEDWNEGVIGIVASRIVEMTGLPAVVLSVDKEKGIAKGSLRTIPGVSVLEALEECSDLFLGYGGHDAAGGCSLPFGKLPELQRRYSEAVKRQMIEKNVVPFVKVDAGLTEYDINVG